MKIGTAKCAGYIRLYYADTTEDQRNKDPGETRSQALADIGATIGGHARREKSTVGKGKRCVPTLSNFVVLALVNSITTDMTGGAVCLCILPSLARPMSHLKRISPDCGRRGELTTPRIK